MGEMIAGVQMYTLREFCKTSSDSAKALKKVRDMGYRVVQVSGMAEPKDMKEMRKILDDSGITACSTHTGYPRIVEETDKVIEEHKILGCEGIMCPGLPGELHNKEGYLKVAQDFSKVMGKIKSDNLILGYHNHGIELERYGGKTGHEILLENCAGLQAELDTYWVQYGGGDPAEYIEKFAGRCRQLHFKDMGIINNKQVMPPIGTGNLNWKRVVPAAAAAGAKYCLVEMDTPTINAFEALKISLENMLSWGIKTG